MACKLHQLSGEWSEAKKENYIKVSRVLQRAACSPLFLRGRLLWREATARRTVVCVARLGGVCGSALDRPCPT